MGLFDVRFDKIVKDNLPVSLRKYRIIAFLLTLISGIKDVYLKFQNNRAKNLYKLKHRQHIAHLEAVLNDSFDVAFRRIKVENGALVFLPLHIFTNSENKPISLFTQSESQTVALSTEYEIENEGVDFKILIPYSIPYDLGQLKAIVETYKVPGTNFLIQEIL